MPRRKAIVIGAALLAIVVIAALLAPADPLRSKERRAWKDRAIENVTRHSNDPPWLTAQTRPSGPGGPSSRPARDVWVGDDVLLMANGDWIVCQNICRKEDPRISDLFIGRGSDGRWYYSTFHFCKQKVVLRMQDQPASLAQFVDAYWLTPFDGQSDDCLKPTWTAGHGQPWGAEKLQAIVQDPSPAR